MKIFASLCLIGLLGLPGSKLSFSEFPVPPYSKKSLFYIHRSPNPNTVIYEVNIGKQNKIDYKDPVKVYWIRYGEQGQHRELNYLEKTFAYGIKSTPIDSLKHNIQFVASKDKSFVASIDEKGQARAIMNISGKKSNLIKIFVQVAEEGWWPKVAYVEFFGLDIETDKPTYEKMIIK